MKKIMLLAIVTCFILPGIGKNNFNQIIGKWNYSVDAGGTVMIGIFHFFEKDGQISCEIQSSEGYTIPFSKLEKKEENIIYLEEKN